MPTGLPPVPPELADHIGVHGAELVWYADHEGRTRWASRGVAALLGLAPEELQGRMVHELLPPHSAVIAAAHMASQSREPFVMDGFELRNAAGTLVPVRVVAYCLFADDGTYIGSVASLTDLRAEQQLRSKLDVLHELSVSLGDAPAAPVIAAQAARALADASAAAGASLLVLPAGGDGTEAGLLQVAADGTGRPVDWSGLPHAQGLALAEVQAGQGPFETPAGPLFPLRTSSGLHGLLAVEAPTPLGDTDLKFATAVADRTAVALGRASLRDEHARLAVLASIREAVESRIAEGSSIIDITEAAAAVAHEHALPLLEIVLAADDPGRRGIRLVRSSSAAETRVERLRRAGAAVLRPDDGPVLPARHLSAADLDRLLGTDGEEPRSAVHGRLLPLVDEGGWRIDLVVVCAGEEPCPDGPRDAVRAIAESCRSAARRLVLARLEARLRRAERTAQHTERSLEGARIAARLIGTPDLPTALHAAVQELRVCLGCEALVVRELHPLADASGAPVHAIADTSPDDPVDENWRIPELSWDDPASVTWFRPAGSGLHGVAVCPIRVDGEPWGVLALQPRDRTAEDDATFPLIAGLIGTAVERALAVSTWEHVRARMEQAQRLESIGRLAGGIAHDFNNGLLAIRTDASLVAQGSEHAAERAQDILETAGYLSALVGDLLTFARTPDPGAAAETCDAGACLTALQPLLSRLLGDDVTVEVHADPAAPAVRTSADKLRQALVNLALNARDAMPAGGRLAIAVRAADGGRTCAIAVRDTGIGMTPETRARMFDPFFTTRSRADAAGLGLSTVYGIVTAADGRIEVASEPLQGTELTLLLPAAQAADALPGTAPGRALRPGTVLLAEDNPLVRRGLQRYFEREGLIVVAAATPNEALAAARGIDPADTVVVSDIVMPEMEGPELARALRHDAPELPVVFISGHTESRVAASGLALGSSAFVSKSAPPEEILAAIEAVFAGGHAAA